MICFKFDFIPKQTKTLFSVNHNHWVMSWPKKLLYYRRQMIRKKYNNNNVLLFGYHFVSVSFTYNHNSQRTSPKIYFNWEYSWHSFFNLQNNKKLWLFVTASVCNTIWWNKSILGTPDFLNNSTTLMATRLYNSQLIYST